MKPSMTEKEKTRHVALLNKCFEIIKKLYASDAFWGPLYQWINSRVKHGDPLDLIYLCLKEIEKEAGFDHKPIGFWPYMNGIRARIMREMDAKESRAGRGRSVETLGAIMDRAAKEKKA